MFVENIVGGMALSGFQVNGVVRNNGIYVGCGVSDGVPKSSMLCNCLSVIVRFNLILKGGNLGFKVTDLVSETIDINPIVKNHPHCSHGK